MKESALKKSLRPAFLLFRKTVNLLGYELVRNDFVDPMPTDKDEALFEAIRKVRPFTLTSHHRLAAMADAVRYVTSNGVPGAIVECGVWRGGMMMLAAEVLIQCGDTKRDLFLFDTFEGMPPPSSEDLDYAQVTAQTRLEETSKGHGVWCEASLEDVQKNFEQVAYPTERVRFVKGMVEDTLQESAPSQIALLRLDTDWYESTKHELETLFPLLVTGGVLIVDDYGHWQGARKAVDEFFSKRGLRPLLHRIDFSCRVFQKV